jgi:hypothetical protein
LLDAVPDGWQRRRVATRLVEADALQASDIAPVLRRFGRPSDASTVAGTMLAAGAVDLDDLDGLIDARAWRRLATRVGR